MITKVALISCSSIRYMPYMEIYKQILTDNGIEYFIINEHEQETSIAENHYTYRVGVQKNIVGKIKKFFGWRKFVKSVLKKEKINKIVIFTTWPAVKLVDFWCMRFRNNYILDIRDFSCEDNPIYSMLVNHLIRNSFTTNISSERFKTWLTDSPKLQVIHNLPVQYVKKDQPTLKKKGSCVIGYVGLLNYDKQNRVMIDACKDNSRFTFKYKGSIEKKCHLKEYCEENNRTNVVFTGRYNNNDKPMLYDDIDLINAVYGNHSLVVTTALPNKLYDCIIYKKPLIASKGTYLGELVEEYNVGFTVDVDSDYIMETIEHYIAEFDKERFLKGCDHLLARVTNEHSCAVSKIQSYFLGK